MYMEIYPNIYQLEIPLRNSPLKALNCYILKGEKSLIVDTGFDSQENKDLMKQALKDLDIDPRKTSLFLTHLHSDHTGLSHYLESLGIDVYISHMDGSFLQNMKGINSPHWLRVKKLARLQGLEEDKLDIREHPGFRYRPKELPKLKYTKEGDIFEIADYRLEVLDLPGHTPGLQALYDKDQGLIFSGDHLLEDISPNITFWGEEFGDSLGIYLDNLRKLRELNIKQVFSSHRSLPLDHKKRIEELTNHHKARLDEILSILESRGPSTVREVTMSMDWDIRARSWQDFPSSQKWFAAGEAQAHLIHLREKNQIKEELQDGLLIYKVI